MRNKILISVLVFILVLATLVTVVACGENYRRKAIATDMSNTDVASNGGIAVKYGKYLYFINGYGGDSAINNFGKAVKGAVMRMEIKDGKLLKDTLVTIVPKNVFDKEKKVGIYIVGEYIYYTSPSVEKNAKGEAKKDHMALMRTKVDGTGTQLIKTFESYSFPFKITKNGYILYFDQTKNEIHEINLGSKKFVDKVVAEKVTAHKFFAYSDVQNEFENSVIYTKTSEGRLDSHTIVSLYRAGGETKTLINGKDSYSGQQLLPSKGYSLSLTQVDFKGKGFRLYYTKADTSSTNNKSGGNYFCDFNSDLNFKWEKENRLNVSAVYNSYDYLDENNILALTSGSYDLLTKDGASGWAKPKKTIEISSLKIITNEVSGSDVYSYYINSSKVYKIRILSKGVDGKYAVNIGGTQVIYNGSYGTESLEYDKVGNNIYFYNSDVKNYTYYVNIPEVLNGDAPTNKGQRIGIISVKDELGMLEAPPEDKK